MSTIIDLDTSEKIVSLIVGLAAIAGLLFRKWHHDRTPGKKELPESAHIRETVNASENNSNKVGNITQNLNISSFAPTATDGQNNPTHKAPGSLKRDTRILFIDGDKKFKIAGILKRMGWDQVKMIRDVSNLDETDVLNSDVLFIDIQGVGLKMNMNDEGLGLALAIKRRHPEKKIIIYSAQETGERFHQALNEADYTLPKNAEPVRFEETLLRVLKK